MKKTDCPDLTRFDDLDQMRKDDPLKLHLAECPRCRALLKSRNVFIAQPDLSTEVEERAQAADEKMTAFLNDTLFSQGQKSEVSPGDSKAFTADETAPAQSRESRSTPEPATESNVIALPGWRRWQLSWLSGAAAAVLLIVFVLTTDLPDKIGLMRGQDSPSSEVITRGEEKVLTQTFEYPSVRYDNEGAFSLSWAVLDGADSYQVLLWSEALQVIETVSVGSATEYRFPDRSAIQSSEPFYFCVVALAGEKEIARSEMISLP